MLRMSLIILVTDAFARFKVFDVLWPGATPDISCYKQSSLYVWFLQGKIPAEFSMVLVSFISIIFEHLISIFTCNHYVGP
jgi:hypothetical protein